jgi:NADPH:quinone reductase-like Zn-dependent oxidoreductase
MKAARIHSYGGTDAFVYEDAPRPVTGDDEALVRVHATTVNPFDCAARAGYVSAYYNYTFPLILGLDVAGVVEAVGANVTSLAVGDEVYGRTDPARNGAYAEYVTVPATQLAPKPKSLDFIHAAAVPHVLVTAWLALIQTANLSAGQTILIHGAAGGVGHMSVQLAKLRGAHVIGTSSANNLDFLRELGADHALDYNTTPFEDVAHEVDVVLDTIGGETQERSWTCLKPGGILLSPIQPPSEEIAIERGVRQQFIVAYRCDTELLSDFTNMIEAGQIKPTVSTILPLQEVGRGHELVEARHTRGKLVLQVSD